MDGLLCTKTKTEHQSRGGGGSQPNPDCEVSIENIKESSN